MHLLTIIGIIIGGLLALLLLVALLTPRAMRLQKNIVIQRSQRELYDYARHLRNQENYSVWVMRDPAIRLTYSGTDGTVGSTAAWTSDDKNVGKGEQEVKELVPDQRIFTELRFEKPFRATNYATTLITPAGNGATVTMEFSGRSPYPMNIMNLFMNQLIGKDMEHTLANMKGQLEKTIA